MNNSGVVFMTAPTFKEAERIADELVCRRLAACVNIISGIKSVYWWDGKPCRDNEVFFIAKTTEKLFPSLMSYVKKVHSYKVPEIIFIPIQDGLPEYLSWIKDVTVENEGRLTD